jgi:hypothetical protein
MFIGIIPPSEAGVALAVRGTGVLMVGLFAIYKSRKPGFQYRRGGQVAGWLVALLGVAMVGVAALMLLGMIR